MEGVISSSVRGLSEEVRGLTGEAIALGGIRRLVGPRDGAGTREQPTRCSPHAPEWGSLSFHSSTMAKLSARGKRVSCPANLEPWVWSAARWEGEVVQKRVNHVVRDQKWPLACICAFVSPAIVQHHCSQGDLSAYATPDDHALVTHRQHYRASGSPIGRMFSRRPHLRSAI